MRLCRVACEGEDGRAFTAGRVSVKAPGPQIPARLALDRATSDSRNRREREMTQTTGRFFDELGKLITEAAGAAEGVRKEIDSIVRAQAERVLHGLELVQREEFEAVKAMAQKAREENERLSER